MKDTARYDYFLGLNAAWSAQKVTLFLADQQVVVEAVMRRSQVWGSLPLPSRGFTYKAGPSARCARPCRAEHVANKPDRQKKSYQQKCLLALFSFKKNASTASQG